jgi:REP element-mobilizing transposase RayT
MAHTYSNLLVHALFSTKNRAPLLDAELKPELFPYMGGIVAQLRGKPLLIGGPKDHVHLLFVLPCSLSVADLMEKVKANSSKWVKNRWRNRCHFAWQTGYTAFSVSQSNLESVKRYIASQETHHRRITFQEEILAFLKKHEIPYDPRFVFD